MSTCDLTAVQSGHSPSRLKSWQGLLEFEKTLFVIVSMMDVVMTYLLLQTGAFYESNPIANFFLTGWGMIGMTAFKLILVGFVLLIVNLVAMWRISSARRVLYFGSTLIGMVVAYSTYLMLVYQGLV